MPRTRAKAPPRLTRDAERLIALANGLNASGSLTEDRFWEAEMSALVAQAAGERQRRADRRRARPPLPDQPRRLRHADRAGRERERVGGRDAGRPRLAGAARGRADRGVVEVLDSLRRDRARGGRRRCASSSRRHVLADGARVTLVPYLYSIDQLPRHFSELRKLTARLADAAITGEVPRLDLARLPETAHLLADTRFLVGLRRGAARASRSSAGRRTPRATRARAAASSSGSRRRGPPSHACCRAASSSACCPTPTT